MHVLKRVTLAILAVALVGSLVACSDQTSEANDAIGRANAKISEYNKRDAEISDLMDKTSALGATAKEAKQGVELVDQILAKVTEQEAAVKAAKVEYEKIAEMDVSEEIKTYARMQIEIADKELEGDAVVKELGEEMRTLYSQIVSGKITEASLDEISKTLDKKLEELSNIQAKISELQAEADTYFQEKGLGE